MSLNDWKEQTYNEVFDNICADLEQRRRAGTLTRLGLRQQLDGLYVQQGDDWIGRGEVARLTLNATVAAFEHVAAEWDAEERRG